MSTLVPISCTTSQSVREKIEHNVEKYGVHLSWLTRFYIAYGLAHATAAEIRQAIKEDPTSQQRIMK